MTTTNNTESKKVTKTAKGITYKAIAKHIKSIVWGIDEYNVITQIDQHGSHVIVTPKEGNTIHCIQELVTIAASYRANHYVTVNCKRS